MLKPSTVQKHARINIYNTLAFSALLHASKNWGGETRIIAAAMKFMRTGTTKYTRMDYKRNDDIKKELETEPTLNKILKYKTSMLTDCKETVFPTIKKLQTTWIKKLGRSC
jgi:hypothetical protein